MEEPEELQDGWEKRQSRNQPDVWYYIHPDTGRTQREAPLRKKPRIEYASPAVTPTTPQAVDVGGGAGGLFDGLPEAASTTCEVKQSVPEVKKPVTSVRCLHLLKKHTGSRRPSSWREKVITRSIEEATYALKEFRKVIAAKETFEERRAEFEKLARRESDCGSASEGGSLGRFRRGQMQKAFEDAAFALEVQELSGIVTTESGCHIILRME